MDSTDNIKIVFLIMRRMRQPLLTLIVVYAVAVLGLTLIQGDTPQGESWSMSIFHAFYFVSYMATTIGFGEIPYEFNDAQRLWVTLCMYAAVVAWIYALGTILSLLQDKTFQRTLAERSFARRIQRMREPFYLVCGYGETGSALVRALTDRSQHAAVIDHDEQKTNDLQLQNLRDYVPALHADARVPKHLQEAGLSKHSRCDGVVAVTDDNDTNLKIAITSKLLHPEIKVICRADSRDVEANMDSFGTDYIIDPFDTFSRHLAMAFQAPCLCLLQRWLSGVEFSQLEEPTYPPHQGRWIVCGYGRFGKAMVECLRNEGIEVVVIETSPEITGEPPPGYVIGRGTEEGPLREAGLEGAVGVVAGTNDDTDNLSIVMTARDINPGIFTILRQNQSENQPLIDAINSDMVMHPSSIIADKIRLLLGTPMLHQFISLSLHQDDAWGCELISRISGLVGNLIPDVQQITLNRIEASALPRDESTHISLGDLLRDPWKRERQLPCIVLLVQRRQETVLLPDADFELKEDDKILLCGDNHAFDRLHWNLNHASSLEYVRTGEVKAQGWLWKKIQKMRK